MLERDKSLRRPAEIISEEITLAPGETKEARFKTWADEKLATPRFCATHPRTQLSYDRSFSGVQPASEECRKGNGLDGERRSVFKFCVVLRCHACRCAYALCPPLLHESTFDKFNVSTPNRATVRAGGREFLDQVNKQSRGFAAFVGGAGTGKTMLACIIVGELKVEEMDALYVRQGQLTVALRASYGRKDFFLHRNHHDDADERPEEPRTPLEIVQDVRFLVLDEIGCAPLANDERLLLDELLKHRYDERKPTILISNLPLSPFKEFLGDALADRIRHATGHGKFILQFSGESFRSSTGDGYLTR